MAEQWRDRASAVMQAIDKGAGSNTAIVSAVLVMVFWMVVGAVSGFTETWFAILHAVTGGTAFIMVFLIRHADGRESRATLLKLDELVAATAGAPDDVIGVEQESLVRQEKLEKEAPHGNGRPDLVEEPDARLG